MINIETFKSETIPFRALVLIALVTGLGVLFYLTGGARGMLAVLTMVITEGGLLLLLTLSSACWGDLVVGKLLGKDTPPLLRFATSAGIGLGMWSLAMLLVGSQTTGLLKLWMWWPLIAGGFIVGAVRYRHSLDRLRVPTEVRSHAMIWILLAAAVAIWLAGASRPPELFAGAGDSGEAARFLQLPREYFNAGHIGTLDHNVYSHFPQNTEMLYLTMMCLRGDAYTGLYAAKLVHGLYAILAAMAVIGALPNRKPRGYSAAVLLATTPLVLVASWYARADLPGVLYMALAVLWLGRWLTDQRWQSAVVVGMAMGAACAGNYQAMLIIVVPTLVAMAVASLRTPKGLTHVVLATAIAAAVFSPWAIRSVATTGNPVFPLASSSLGTPAEWSPECQQRWLASHGRQFAPPVPTPEGRQQPDAPNALVRLYRGVLFNELFGPMTLALAGLAVCLYVAGKDQNRWDSALIAIIAMQLGVWLWLGANAAPLSLIAIVVPLSLLVGGMMERIYPIKSNPFRPKQDIPNAPWGPMAAKVLVVLAVTVSLLVALSAQRYVQKRFGPTNAAPAREGAAVLTAPFDLGEAPRLMLIGETGTFYFPSNTIYATAYNTHPLEAMIAEGLTDEAILTRLQEMGVTHLWVNWQAIYSLANSCGYPAALSGDVTTWTLDAATGRLLERPRIAILEGLEALGMTEVPIADFLATDAPAEEAQEEQPDPEQADESDGPIIPVAVFALPQPPQATPAE